MKKFILSLFALMLLFCLALPAYAASAQMHIGVSSGTVSRGDNVTVTVKLSNGSAVSNGGIVLKYDSSILSYEGGSCNVSGAATSNVNSGGGVFALETDKAVSGTIFTFKFKVKSDAKFGSTSISGSGNLDSAAGKISCSVSGTTLTISCRHDFKNCTKVSDSQHESTCSICGEKKKENHTWDAGTVIKAATCKETGSKKFVCSGCKAEKSEVLEKTNDHKYSSYANLNDKSHTAVCTVCQVKSTLNHNWNKGKVNKAATCQETGSKTLTCKNCSATKEDIIPKAAHSFTPWEAVDENSHTHSCTVCKKEETKSHNLAKELLHNETVHFTGCKDCNFTKDSQDHVPGPAATATTDQICTVCNRVLQIRTDHEHELNEGWMYDSKGHWNNCSLCDQKCNYTEHTYETNCQSQCTICSAERTAPHDPDGNWITDPQGHWQICKSCGEKAMTGSHTPGAAATAATPQLCTDCAYELAPALPHEHFDGAHSHICECGETYESDEDCPICREARKDFPWWILCIAEAVIFAGAAGAYFYLKRKKEAAQLL